MVNNVDYSKSFHKLNINNLQFGENNSGNVSDIAELKSSAQQKKNLNIEKATDKMLPEDSTTKFKAGVEQSLLLPEYAVRGLKGDPESNFFEFLKLGKIPYYLGGPLLIFCFAAAKNKFVDNASKIMATTKQKAAGVALYYLAMMAAKAAIDLPVKWFTGVDLNQPYRKIINLRADSPDGRQSKKEYHKLFESIDFTRWDLLYRGDDAVAKNPKLINENYDKIARKLGMGKEIDEVNDSSAVVKPQIRKLITAASAWKYLLAVPFIAAALGIASQSHWEDFGAPLGDFKNAVTHSANSLFKRIKEGLDITTRKLFWEPFKNSVVDFWKGQGVENKIFKHAGKFSILASLGAVVLANVMILRSVSVKRKEFVNASAFLDAQTGRNNAIALKEPSNISDQPMKKQEIKGANNG